MVGRRCFVDSSSRRDVVATMNTHTSKSCQRGHEEAPLVSVSTCVFVKAAFKVPCLVLRQEDIRQQLKLAGPF